MHFPKVTGGGMGQIYSAGFIFRRKKGIPSITSVKNEERYN